MLDNYIDFHSTKNVFVWIWDNVFYRLLFIFFILFLISAYIVRYNYTEKIKTLSYLKERKTFVRQVDIRVWMLYSLLLSIAFIFCLIYFYPTLLNGKFQSSNSERYENRERYRDEERGRSRENRNGERKLPNEGTERGLNNESTSKQEQSSEKRIEPSNSADKFKDR